MPETLLQIEVIREDNGHIKAQLKCFVPANDQGTITVITLAAMSALGEHSNNVASEIANTIRRLREERQKATEALMGIIDTIVNNSGDTDDSNEIKNRHPNAN